MEQRATSTGGSAAARPSPVRTRDLRFARVEVLCGEEPHTDSVERGADRRGAAEGEHVYSSTLWLILLICWLTAAAISLLPRRLLRRPMRGGVALLAAQTRARTERAGAAVRLRSAGARLASRARASATTLAAAFGPIPEKK